MTTYSGEADQLAIAQQALDDHVTASATGRCLACGVPGPCFRRETAVVVFSRFLRLPRRVPGQTRPELVGARRVPGPRRDADNTGLPREPVRRIDPAH